MILGLEQEIHKRSLEHPVASESKKVLGKNKNKKHLRRVYIKRRQETPKELPIAKAGPI